MRRVGGQKTRVDAELNRDWRFDDARSALPRQTQ